MSTNWGMDKQNMIHLYYGILFSNKKEWNSDEFCNMDDPWKHYAKGKKPKTYIVQLSL